MAIINRYNMYEMAGIGGELLRNGRRINPRPSYRELLAAEPTPEQAAFGLNFFPYEVEAGGKGVLIISIPHGLTTDPNNPIVPDVVIPVPVYVYNENPDAFLAGDVRPLIDGTATLSSSGWSADGDNVYLAVAFTTDQSVYFFVYIEWTHSVIKNEVVTGAYEYIASVGF
jgi:hypothetical protein